MREKLVPFTAGALAVGLTAGTTLDSEIELTEGDYLYSCPLNPTPDYRFVVKS